MNQIKIFKTIGGDYILSRVCSTCELSKTATVKAQDYFHWRHGIHIQHAFPYLTIDQRELLISGICGECFDKMFADVDNLHDESESEEL